MKPNEQNSQHETIPKYESEAVPTPRFGERYNGMYDNEEEFKVAEARYRLNPTSLEAQTSYPIATTHETIETSAELSSPEADPDVIDVEARVVVINPESPDETDDIAELIENNDELMVGTEKLVLTSQLKELARAVLASLDQIISTPESDLPEEIDWLPFIMSEPEYDPGYDYTLLQRLLTAQYNRERALALTRHTLNPMRFESTPMQHSAATEELPEDPTELAQVENDEILKIEYDRPTETEVPALEYEGNPPTLPNEETPGRSPG